MEKKWVNENFGFQGDQAIIDHIAPAMMQAQRPFTLYFGYCNLSMNCIPSLVKAIELCSTITSLSLGDNPGILDGYAALKQAVISSSSHISYFSSPGGYMHKDDIFKEQRDFRFTKVREPIFSLLISLGFDDSSASKLARWLFDNELDSVESVLHTSDALLVKCGFTSEQIAIFKEGKSRLAKKESGTVPSLLEEPSMDPNLMFLYDAAKVKFPNQNIFRDTDQHFALSALVANVKKSKNILVFLSPNYGSSPYCMVEMVTAVRCGAHISTVLVHKPGLGMFDFAAVNAKLASGNVSSF